MELSACSTVLMHYGDDCFRRYVRGQFDCASGEPVKVKHRTHDECGVPTLAQLARGEAAENFDRKDFTPSEAVSIKRELEPEMKAAAKDRMLNCGKGVQVAHPSRASEQVAAFTGIAARTLDKADTIVKAAEAEPDKFDKLVEDMELTICAVAPAWPRW